MKLIAFSVSNYRSIKPSKKIYLKDYTVLVGKNNEGKSNLLRALNLAISTLQIRVPRNPRIVKNYSKIGFPLRRLPIQRRIDFDPEVDLPIRNKRTHGSKIKLFFQLTDNETLEFKQKVGRKINNELDLEFIYTEDSTVKIHVSKKGGKEWSTSIFKILNFVSTKIGFNYIPAIRTENEISNIIHREISSSISILRNTPKYQNLIEQLVKIENESIKQINKEISDELKIWIPNITDVQMEIDENFYSNRFIGTRIYVTSNGTRTLLENKGDGVQSLFAMALLAQNYSKEENEIIAIDEPEAHLHPDAVRKLQKTISNLSNKTQIIIATHNPILVNRNQIDSNVIISEGHVRKARNIKEIRDVLGVSVSDNLFDAEKIIAVEGISDQEFLKKLIKDKGSQKIKNYLKSNALVIIPLHGITKLENKIRYFQDMAAEYYIIADDDNTSRENIKKAVNDKLLSIGDYTYIPHEDCQGNSELENLYSDNIIASAWKSKISKDIDITEELNKHKNKSLKWSKRMKLICSEIGENWDDIKDSLKTEISNNISNTENIDNCLTKDGKEHVKVLIKKIQNHFFNTN